MAPRLRIAAVSLGVAVSIVVLGLGNVDAQRRAVPRSPAPQGRQAVPRPLPARPLPARPLPGARYYRGPTVYRPYYASPYYWYGGYYGGYYSYPFYFSMGGGPYAPYYGYPYYPWYPYDAATSLRLQVTPREAQVFVDGAYAGRVDDFDGTFQRLRIYPGDHTIEVFLPGHRTLTQRIYLQPGKTFTLRAALEPLAPGESESVRPSDGADAPVRIPQVRPSDGDDDENGGEAWPPQSGAGTAVGLLAFRLPER